MEILFISEDGNLFGKTSYIGIGKRRPKQIYGEKAKELREKAGLSIEELAKEFKLQVKYLEGIEKQEKGMTENNMQKYIEKFGVEREYFFDIDLETLILGDNGMVLKTFENSKDCKGAYKMLLEEFAKRKDNSIKNIDLFVDFRDVK
jgi:transcriptional regulator with XRE-family HTH domain